MTIDRRKNYTVLVAEDEDALQSLAILTIKEKGLSVLAASCAEEAIRLWDRHAYDIVLLFTDIVLHGPLNGFDIVRHIRAIINDKIITLHLLPRLPIDISASRIGQ